MMGMRLRYADEDKGTRFKYMGSLESVNSVIDEANEALNDPSRTISDSPISEVLLYAAVMAGDGEGYTLAALYERNISGPFRREPTADDLMADMTTDFTVKIMKALGFGFFGDSDSECEQLENAKQLCYEEALKKQNAVIEALEKEANADKERIEYLTSLSVMLKVAIKDLRHDLGIAA